MVHLHVCFIFIFTLLFQNVFSWASTNPYVCKHTVSGHRRQACLPRLCLLWVSSTKHWVVSNGPICVSCLHFQTCNMPGQIPDVRELDAIMQIMVCLPWTWHFMSWLQIAIFFFSLWSFLQWRFKGAKGSALREDIYILHENGTLEIPVAQKDSTGTYTCVARNKLGMAKNEVHLEIKGEAGVTNIF